MKKKKIKKVKIRKPIAPPSIRHKSKKDYDRQGDKVKLRKRFVDE